MYIPEATYLAWVDPSRCLPAGTDLPDFFANKAGVLLERWKRLVRGQRRRICPAESGHAPGIIETGLVRMTETIQKEQE